MEGNDEEHVSPDISPTEMEDFATSVALTQYGGMTGLRRAVNSTSIDAAKV
jgi:hypothetical protein